MANSGIKIALPATSLLVMYWLGPNFYKSDEVVSIVNSLDLQEGKEIAEKFKPIWSHFDQIVQNRKFAILQFVKSLVEKGDHQFQLINLGAGIDPLSLEISVTHNIPIVFDVDFDTGLIEQKSNLISKLDIRPNIRLVSADVANTDDLNNALKLAGWDHKKQTVVIAEGLSYYVEDGALWNSLKLFRSSNNQNHLILEYYKDDSNIDKKFQNIAREGFGLVYEDVGMLTRYNRTVIESRVKPLGGILLDTYTHKRSEYERYGANKIFLSDKSGWSEISLCRI